jgi:integrase/recombinase XerD
MEQLKDYKVFLTERSYRDNTIHGYLQSVESLMQWITANGYEDAASLNYNDLLQYVQHEQKRGIAVQTINIKLLGISLYYEHLKQQEIIIKNPAKTLRIKGKAKTVTEQPLKYDELENLYNSYKAVNRINEADYKYPLPKHVQQRSNLVHQRNIVIVGLLVWQGLHSGELQRLEVGHINLQEGIIYIPSMARSNSRELRLHTAQILPLHHYIYQTREQLQPKEEELFPGDAHNIINRLTEELKGINPKIKNALHIRSSVILHWLRQHNKRQVQYMIGHKYIDSTERYKVQELESLTQALMKHHPFG